MRVGHVRRTVEGRGVSGPRREDAGNRPQPAFQKFAPGCFWSLPGSSGWLIRLRNGRPRGLRTLVNSGPNAKGIGGSMYELFFWAGKVTFAVWLALAAYAAVSL